MPLETATYIDDLVVTNPAASDGMNGADDHMRMIKSVVKNTFPNFTSAALNSTQAQIDGAVASIAAILANVGALCPPGAIMDFGMATVPAGWLNCDGQAISRTTYAALFTAVGTTWGAGDGSTTFNVPPAGARFRRHRDNAALASTVGTLQSPANLAHTHAVVGVTGNENQAHNHGFGGTTGTDYPDHTHATTIPVNSGPVTGGGAFSLFANAAASNTGGASTRHQHDFSGTTGSENQNHNHNISFTSGGGSADNANETRPYSMTVLTCIKI